MRGDAQVPDLTAGGVSVSTISVSDRKRSIFFGIPISFDIVRGYWLDFSYKVVFPILVFFVAPAPITFLFLSGLFGLNFLVDFQKLVP